MNFGLLKIIRVIVSLIFFLLVTFIFIDFTGILSSELINGVIYLQLIPSVLSFLGLAGIATAGFIFIFILTLIFGRLYCSSICPLGTFQDIIIWIKKKIGKKRIFRKQRSFYYLQYALLIIAIIMLISGLIHPLLLLDPYSNYGRIAANIFRPLYLLLNNLGASGLESMEVYTLYRVEPGVTHWFTVSFSIGFLILISWLSIKYARLFCNTLCPVGTILGLLSRFSLFRIHLDQNLCTSCGKCSAVCKSGCIDAKGKKVDFSRCIACLNCLSSCPSNGVLFDIKGKKRSVSLETYEPSRRNFIAGAIAGAGTLGLLSLPLVAQQRKRCRGSEPIEVIKEFPVCPPGSQSINHLNNYCTACHLCVSICPTHVIKPALLEYGLAGMMQPRMDYAANYCNFDCTACTEICPTGALRPVSIEDKHVLQLGKVEFIKQNCVVHTEGTDCGACSEHCPTKAVYMIPYKEKLFLPEVNPDICVGCGACEYACPTDPKSIYVEGNPVHLIAEKPIIETLEQPDPEEDFPF